MALIFLINYATLLSDWRSISILYFFHSLIVNIAKAVTFIPLSTNNNKSTASNTTLAPNTANVPAATINVKYIAIFLFIWFFLNNFVV